jgi:hypothetical protein
VLPDLENQVHGQLEERRARLPEVGAPIVVTQADQPAGTEYAPDFAQRSQRLAQVLNGSVGVCNVERGVEEGQLVQACNLELDVGEAALAACRRAA